MSLYVTCSSSLSLSFSLFFAVSPGQIGMFLSLLFLYVPFRLSRKGGGRENKSRERRRKRRHVDPQCSRNQTGVEGWGRECAGG